MNKQNFVKQQEKLEKQEGKLEKQDEKQQIEKEKKSKFVKKSLEILLAHAITEKDFKVLEYSISDYLRQGYHVKNFVGKYHEAYKRWKRINERKNN